MRLRLITGLMGLVPLLMISSCATAPKPLAPGEVRLSSMQVLDAEKLRVNTPFLVSISFEAEGEPEIRTACFSFSGDGPHCFKVTNVIYGSPGNIKIEIRTKNPGSSYLECYVGYIRDGKIQATNAISTHFRVLTPPVKGSPPVR